jgi:acetyl/propionyl-CoA carboxylase alpha subunit
VECRVYAEDPRHQFLPQAGPLLRYREPSGPGIRVDSGVVEGDTIGIDYDPLIAKLISHAESRDAAFDRAAAALRSFPILGIRTNLTLLGRLMGHADVRRGAVHATFIDERLEELTVISDTPLPAVAAAAHALGRETGARAADRVPQLADPWTTLAGWRAGNG